jgi:hypothetical protein
VVENISTDYRKDEGKFIFPVNFFAKNDVKGKDRRFWSNPESRIQNPDSFLLKAKILWLDIEKRYADYAAAKVESYF